MSQTRGRDRWLVTGAEGFIGAAVVRQLVERGADVHATIFDDTTRWRLQGLERRLAIRRMDLRDPRAVEQVVRTSRPRRVVHLAALVDTRREAALITPMFQTNVDGTRHLLQALASHRVEAAILAGTAEEYGGGPIPCRPGQAEQPVSPYSWSKAAAAGLARMYRDLWGVSVAVARFGVTYGPGQDNALFIPSLIRACLAGEALPMTPGLQAREFNYVEDIAAGLIAAARAQGAKGHIIHLGSGQTHKLREVVRIVMKLTSTPVEPRYGALPYRTGEPMVQQLDLTETERLLGWRARVGLEEGLEQTVAWFRQRVAGPASRRRTARRAAAPATAGTRKPS